MRATLKPVVLIMLAAVVLGADEPEKPIKLDEQTKIDSYSQGKITIGGKLIRTDIVILPDGTVKHPWSTKKRHFLTAEDIPDIIDLELDVLIIGTGRQGLMKPSPELKKKLKEKKYEVLTLKTAEAIKKLTALRADGKKVAACFHIGC